jgi:hypothetical protein
MAVGAYLRISAATVWYAAPAAAAPAEAVTLCIALKAAQKLVAAPTETLVAFAEAELVVFADVD